MTRLPSTVASILAALQQDAYALNSIMEFDSPITVHENGTVSAADAGIYAPTLYDDQLDDSRWELLNGYSGQYSYSGPIMHTSEFIGGGMARDILAEPGTYVALTAEYSAEFTYEACGAESVRCRHCDAYIAPDGEGCWEDESDMGSSCTPEKIDHDPEDQESDGWAVARLIPRD